MQKSDEKNSGRLTRRTLEHSASGKEAEAYASSDASFLAESKRMLMGQQKKVSAARYNITQLRANTALPPGFADFVLARGQIEGEFVTLSGAAVKEINESFPFRPFMQEMKLRLADLRLNPGHWPAGFVDFVLAHGKVDKEVVVLDEVTASQLRKQFPRSSFPKPPPPPTLAELASNFTGAMSGWAKAGFKVIKRKEYERRHAICLACEFWLPEGMMGMGKCKRCGCSGFKLWLASSTCPDQPARW